MSSDWTKPTTTSNYSTEFIQQLDARLKDLAYGLDPLYTTASGLPTNSFRVNWGGSDITLQSYNGTTWSTIAKNINMTSIAATTLATTRSIALSGDATGSVSFNGSANVTISATLTSVNAVTSSVGNSSTIPVLAFNTKGQVTSIGTATVSQAISSTGSVTSAPITLQTGTGVTTLARIQSNATGNILYLGNGTTVNSFSHDTLAATLQNKTLGTACTWNGNTLGVTYGGSGLTSYAVGDLVYASAATTLAKLADVATGNALISGGVGIAPSYGKIGLTTHISGTLAVGNGGSGLTSYAVGDLVYASAATTLAKLADVATGNALISGGVGIAPSYGKIGLTTHISGTLAVGNGGTGATTLTGILKGAGTGAFTAATSADLTALLGFTPVRQGEGIQAADVTTVASTPYTITDLQAGHIIYITTGGSVVTLPDATAWPVGKALIIQSAVPATVNRTGTQTIYCNGTGQTSLSFGNGDSVTLFAVPGFDGWIAVGNSAQLGASAAFNYSIAANGYQKLPTGLILQWGTDLVPVSAYPGFTGNFPVSFPNGGLSMVASHPGVPAFHVTGIFASKSQYYLTHTFTSSALVAWIAIGY